MYLYVAGIFVSVVTRSPTNHSEPNCYSKDLSVKALVQAIRGLGLCSVTSLRRMSRRILTSNVGTHRLESEGMSQPPTPKPDANSSAELIAAHHDKLGYGTQSKFAHAVRNQLYVQVGERFYGFTSCNFGTATLPWYCGILSAFLAEEIRARGIPVAFYVDDFVIVASSEEEARRCIELVNKIAEELGLPVARHKVQVSQRLTCCRYASDQSFRRK